VLAELGEVAGYHQVEATFRPALFIEPAHRSAQFLGRSRMCCRADPVGHLSVAEQQRLGRHHEVLRRRVRLAIDGERRRPPLAKAALPDLAVRQRPMPPESQVLGLPAIGDELSQLFNGAHIGYGSSHTPVVPPAPSSRQRDKGAW
jgi:hypothetical protein